MRVFGVVSRTSMMRLTPCLAMRRCWQLKRKQTEAHPGPGSHGSRAVVGAKEGVELAFPAAGLVVLLGDVVVVEVDSGDASGHGNAGSSKRNDRREWSSAAGHGHRNGEGDGRPTIAGGDSEIVAGQAASDSGWLGGDRAQLVRLQQLAKFGGATGPVGLRRDRRATDECKWVGELCVIEVGRRRRRRTCAFVEGRERRKRSSQNQSSFHVDVDAETWWGIAWTLYTNGRSNPTWVICSRMLLAAEGIREAWFLRATSAQN